MLRVIERFWRKKEEKKRYRTPEGVRVYAVGDVHGRADLLKQMHELIVMDAGKDGGVAENRVVYLGDYLDRGAHVKETLDEVMSGLPENFDLVHLKGNHEEIFLSFLEDATMLEMWLGLGGQATLLNYGVQPPGYGFSTKRAETVQEMLLDAMPRSHLAFLRGLKPYVQIGDFFFAHAGIRPGRPLDKQSDADLFWIRDEFTGSPADHGVMVVHGHSIKEQVQKRGNRVGIDTGAYATGVLSCLVIENERMRFLSTES